ncbi:DUF4190 domain-containing protein [Streptomyces montanisoli]|uniref:DUF4190 and DUF4352 domain-containing protein n=1 Tax=Streptomyces montanisoli TaxID=2798581 RepID=A0A940MMK5_9ACTN|nr:DUF4190 domain-containing protein [Streptomyces montanisoli]MBP0461163.1 DUF4190 and DUF4352 domain-containing protein [Streptomyces montanisoli]
MSQYTQGPQDPQGPYGQYAPGPHTAPSAPPVQPHPHAQAPAQAQARNGLGIAALILGLVGAISGIIPLLFWLAGVLGLIALVLGLAGRGRAKRGGATNKGVATAGAVLGLVAMIVAVIGAVITFRAVGDAVDSIDKAASGSSASASPAPGHSGTSKGAAGKAGAASKDRTKDKPKDKAKDKALAPGDTAVYDDDLNVTVGEPQAYSPGPYAAGHKVGNHAYKVTVTITNKGSKKYDATLATVAARAGADGREATEIYDDTSGQGFTGQVLPGKKATQVFAFDAPADAKALTVQVTPGWSYNETQWDLPF